MEAVVLVAHGSRLTPAKGSEFERLVEMVRRDLPDRIVTAGSLQFNHPDLYQAVEEAVRQGADKVVVVPVFLFQGNHVLEDIPEALDALRARFPRVSIRYGRHLGPDPAIAALASRRALEALGGE